MRFVCVLIEHFPTCVEVFFSPDLAGKPLVVLRTWDDRVIDAASAASALGISTGDSRQRVEQLCPLAIILTAREELYQSQHDRLRSALFNFASAVENVDLGELLIEVSALARAFPTEADLARHVLQHVEDATRLPPAVGIASNKFTAQQAARQAIEQASRISIVPDGQERRFLEPLPLGVLPDLPAEMSRRLYLFGITTLGGLAQLPHAAATLQFGSEAAFYHDLARGIDPRPLLPHAPPPAISRTLNPLEPTHDRALLLTAVERLTTRLARRLAETGYHALALSLTIFTADGQAHTAGASVKPPSAETEQLLRLAGRLLGKLTCGTDVTGVTVTAYPLREWHHSARQLTLLATPRQVSLVRLQTVIKVLKQRFGEAVIKLASLIGPPVPLAIKVTTQPNGWPLTLSWGGWSRPVKTVWNEWREQSHWWDQPVARSYYQIEVGDGALYTVFCDDRGGWFMDRRRS
jgi:DNA polymerase-4